MPMAIYTAVQCTPFQLTDGLHFLKVVIILSQGDKVILTFVVAREEENSFITWKL